MIPRRLKWKSVRIIINTWTPTSTFSRLTFRKRRFRVNLHSSCELSYWTFQEHLLVNRRQEWHALKQIVKKKRECERGIVSPRSGNESIYGDFINWNASIFELLENELDDNQAKKIPLRISSSRLASLFLSLSLWLVAWVNETCIIVAREAETRSDIVASSKIVAPLLVLDRARSRADLERNSLPNFDSIFRFTRRRRRGRSLWRSLWRSLKEEENSFPIFIFRFARHSRDFSAINDHEPEKIDLYFDKERGFVRSKYLTRFHSGKSKEDRENFLIGETVLPPRPFVERELRGKNLQIFLKRKKKKKN